MHVPIVVILLVLAVLIGGEELLRLAFGGILKILAWFLILYAVIMAAGFLLWGLQALYEYLASLSAAGMVLVVLAAAAAVVLITKSVSIRKEA